MKENKYDEQKFFMKYSEMERSKKGLQGAGEWTELQKILPDFKDKKVLDLGCGYGWHCKYAADQGASSVLGTDISHKMLETAKRKNSDDRITYQCSAMEDLEFPAETFDIVISSLAFHYVKEYEQLMKRIVMWLKQEENLFFLWSILCSPPMEHRTGIIMLMEIFFIFLWTIIIMRGKGMQYFWGRRLQNIIEL